jgi:pimeloyl-ACP methyl ester carboxylesterase
MNLTLSLLFLLISLSAYGNFTSRGPFEITHQDFKAPNRIEPRRPIDARLTRPRDNMLSEVIILLNGFGQSRDRYQYYADHLASWGFTVLGLEYLRNRNPLDGEHPYKVQQITEAILALERLLERAITHYGVLGHSLGGKLGFLLAHEDSRVQTILAMDPVNAGGASCRVAPTRCALYPAAPNPARQQQGILTELSITSLIMRSAPDRLLNPESEFNAQWFFWGTDGHGTHGTPGFSVYYDFGKLSHGGYIPRQQNSTVNLITRTLTAWFLQELRGEDHSPHLIGDVIEADVSAGLLDSYFVRY